MQTASGIPFKVVALQGNKIYIQTSRGNTRNFHFNHVADCYHWISVLKRRIQGVGSGPISVRGLIGNSGVLLKCSLCERNSAYIWGILVAMPNVQVRRNGNILFI